MCGIAGGWFYSADIVPDLAPALRSIRHRGPDDSGHEIYSATIGAVALGHTRLSVIDLTEAGHQPMNSADGQWALVFNGEIYNYRELRLELQDLGHRFVSDSDTEVLLAAWIQWGRGCLGRLVGMFAFVVFDRASGKLICVRDAFGIKPFYYAADATSFRFASEAPALLQLLPGKPVLNWQRAYDYLVHGDYDSGPETFFEGVFNLPPASFIEVDVAKGLIGRPVRWRAPSVAERKDWSFPDAAEQVREQFLQNVRLHLRSDVGVGAALSGGIDSSAIVCGIRHVEPDFPIHTFSFIAADSRVSEEDWVDLVNGHVHATGHKVVATPDELARDLDDLICTQGEPFGSTSIYAQYRVFKLARERGITVTLDGQGADEMLAGYSGYPGQRLRSLVETGRWVEACGFLGTWGRWPGRSRTYALQSFIGQVTQGRLYDTLRALGRDDLVPDWIDKSALDEHGVVCRFPIKTPANEVAGRRVVAELADSLSVRGVASLLRHGDRNSMRFSIESRVPFLTPGLADLLLSMPEEFLVSQRGETKHVFRAAMRGIVPDVVLDRRDKVGFATPEASWLPHIKTNVREWLSVDLELPFLRRDELIREFDAVMAGSKPFTSQVWRWINFSRWYSHYFLSASTVP